MPFWSFVKTKLILSLKCKSVSKDLPCTTVKTFLIAITTSVVRRTLKLIKMGYQLSRTAKKYRQHFIYKTFAVFCLLVSFVFFTWVTDPNATLCSLYGTYHSLKASARCILLLNWSMAVSKAWTLTYKSIEVSIGSVGEKV